MEKTAAPQVYGADEINAFVLDPGSDSIQSGYAGYDQPSLILPSYYGIKDNNKTFDENLLYTGHHDEIKKIRENNMIVDWEGATAQFNYIINRLKINTAEQPVLLTESTLNSYNNKVKAMEYFFNKENFCAYYTIKQPTCSSFAHGRPNCLVVDVGHDLVTVTPVIDGLCLKNHVKGTNFAGNFINEQLKAFLEQKNITYVPQFQVKSKSASYWESNESTPVYEVNESKKDVHASVINFSYQRTLREMKELLLECCMDDEALPEPTDFKAEIDSETTRWFELPNGMNVPFTKYERQKLANSLFNPNDLLNPLVEWNMELGDGNIMNNLVNKFEVTSKDYVPLRRSKRSENGEPEAEAEAEADDDDDDEKMEDALLNDNVANTSNQPLGLSRLIQSSLDSLDIDLKPQLANNIVLTGSSSLIPRLNERINNELMNLNPSLKIRVHSAGNTIERKYSTWIGGSILSSLGTFHQMWVSKAEYEEVGPDQLIINRFR